MALPGKVRRRVRGLHPDDVDRQLVALAEHVQRLDAENQELRRELDLCAAADPSRERLLELVGESVAGVLRAAEGSAEEIVRRAEVEAERVRRASPPPAAGPTVDGPANVPARPAARTRLRGAVVDCLVATRVDLAHALLGTPRARHEADDHAVATPPSVRA